MFRTLRRECCGSEVLGLGMTGNLKTVHAHRTYVSYHRILRYPYESRSQKFGDPLPNMGNSGNTSSARTILRMHDKVTSSYDTSRS